MATKKTTGLQQVLRALMHKEIVDGKPMSANELAKRSEVPQSTISRILAGQSKDVRQNVLERLAAHFNITIGQLRGEESLGDRLSPFEMAKSHTTSIKKGASAVRADAQTLLALHYIDNTESEVLTLLRTAKPQQKAALIAALRTMVSAVLGDQAAGQARQRR
jgi:transcriptional regulator with XRE-family HTH domain